MKTAQVQELCSSSLKGSDHIFMIQTEAEKKQTNGKTNDSSLSFP